MPEPETPPICPRHKRQMMQHSTVWDYRRKAVHSIFYCTFRWLRDGTEYQCRKYVEGPERAMTPEELAAGLAYLAREGLGNGHTETPEH